MSTWEGVTSQKRTTAPIATCGDVCCGFESRPPVTEPFPAAYVTRAAEQHVSVTGHTVSVIVTVVTDYAPENAEVTA